METQTVAAFEAQMDDAFGVQIESAVALHKLAAYIQGVEAQVINAARRTVRVTEEEVTRVIGGKRVGWSPEVVAHRTVSSELAAALRIPERTASRLVSTSQTLVEELPATQASLLAGKISWQHATRMVDHAITLPVEARGSFETTVLPYAEKWTAAKFTDKARTVRERVHPESIAVRRQTECERRRVEYQPDLDGMAWLSAYLPAELAIAADNRLTHITDRLKTKDEPRTRTQIRADVLSDLLITGVDGLDGTGTGITATVAVTVPVMTLMGQSELPGNLDGYGPIAPEVAQKLAAEAPSFMRILTHPETGALLSFGRKKYTPPKDLREWIRLRDGTCRHIGCAKPAGQCDIDHTIAWEDGGDTDPNNLAALCPGDHRLKHMTGWKVIQLGDGILKWISPAGREYIDEPDNDLPEADLPPF